MLLVHSNSESAIQKMDIGTFAAVGDCCINFRLLALSLLLLLMCNMHSTRTKLSYEAHQYTCIKKGNYLHITKLYTLISQTNPSYANYR